jgi:putative transposase
LGFYEFRRQLEYKAEATGTRVILADRFYPSSKTCSACGFIKQDLKLSDRQWTCSQCGDTHDRDTNAAINLEKLPKGLGEVTLTETGGSSARKGRGAGRRSENALKT